MNMDTLNPKEASNPFNDAIWMTQIEYELIISTPLFSPILEFQTCVILFSLFIVSFHPSQGDEKREGKKKKKKDTHITPLYNSH